MKSLSLGLVASIVLSFTSHSAVLSGVYQFTGGESETPTQTGVVYGQFSRHGDATAGTYVPGQFNMADSPFGSVDWSTYTQFIVTPAQNYTLTLTSLTFDVAAPTGGRGVSVAIFNSTSVNASQQPGTYFSDFFAGSITRTYNFNDISNSQGVTIRFYGAMEDGSGMSFDNVHLQGEVTPVPEPINVALALFGITFAGVGLGRRYLKRKN